MHRLVRATLPLCVAVVALAFLAGVPTEARKAGVSGQAELGCTCHGGGAKDVSVLPSLEGVPAQYEPGKVYHLTIGVSGGPPYTKAGFDLNASKGKLSVPSDESNAQITTKDTFGARPGEATHKSPSTRSWKVDWTGPQAGSGRVAFHLATNSVNGNDQPDALDKWNLLSKTSDEKNLPPKAVNLVPPRQVGPTRVNVSWSGPVEPDVVRFEIHRGAKPGFPLTAASKAGEVKNNKATSAEVDTLTPNTTYYFHVRIVDKGGLTADSNEASLRLEPHFGGPTTVVAGARNDDGGSAPFPSVALTLLGLLLVARMSRAWPRLDGRRDPPWRSRR